MEKRSRKKEIEAMLGFALFVIKRHEKSLKNIVDILEPYLPELNFMIYETTTLKRSKRLKRMAKQIEELIKKEKLSLESFYS